MTLLRKCTAEFLGSFAIVFVGCGAIIANQLSNGAVSHVGIAVSFGLVVMAMIYATGHISGAHFNPAVTAAFSITGHFSKKEAIPYIVAQLAGATAASLIHYVTLVVPKATDLNIGVTLPFDDLFMTAFVYEFMLTFFLMYIIMAVATDSRAVSKAGAIAVGGTVLFEAMFAGPICNASMNPARSFGPALVSGNWTHFYAYVFGPVLGAIVGALVYEFTKKERVITNPTTD